ncbi:MAG TPA: thioredoxin family protein, partial [Blastocatellia bacterium]|nr:thioredoxin family protein [Blastocatellia bacterium]
LEKLAADGTDATVARDASLSLLDIALDTKATGERVLDYASRAVMASSSATTYVAVARALAARGRYLSEAEKYAREAVGHVTSDMPPEDNAACYGGLGMVLVLRGSYSQAIQYLNLARQFDPSLAETSSDLGRAYEGMNDDSSATKFYLLALAQGSRQENGRRLQNLYRRTHHGSIEGLDALVDRAFLSQPALVDPGVYRTSGTGRRVLVEAFVGTECGPCLAADVAIDAALKRYGNDVTVVNYHVDIPAVDPLANAGSQERLDYYHAEYVPRVFVDGMPLPPLGGYREQASASFDVLEGAIERRLTGRPEAELSLVATLDGWTLGVHCTVTKAPARKGLVLRLALVQGTVRYSALNGIHFHRAVLRNLLSDGPVDLAEARGAMTLDRSIDLMALKNRLAADSGAKRHGELANGPLADIFPGENLDLLFDDLQVIAFVQDNGTKEILQSAQVSMKQKR